MRRLLLILLIIAAPVAVFAAMIWADRQFGAPGRGFDYVLRFELPPAGGKIGLPKVYGPPDASRPLVVIDAGHGGKDPGAGSDEIREKTLTLALALALRDRLLADGGVRVALTREDDRFLSLGERPDIARRLGADVFVSIHADSTESGNAPRGGTIYTLSSKGSNEAAEKIAARENAADTINGVRIREQSNAVSAILVDLSQRETQAQSEELARLILREGRGALPFRETMPQSAAFAVLKSPDVASVLFESGYINNPDDTERLSSTTGRQAFAASTARAIRIFLARQAGTGGQPVPAA